MWTEAYQNTKRVKDRVYNLFIVQICKSCDCQTESKSTQQRQQLGNVIETIHQCTCGKHFVVDTVFR